MKDLYLLSYNNYDNRVIKQEKSLLDYASFMIADVVRNVNFVPGDGVTTEHIVLAKYITGDTPDYVVVAEAGTYDISSRWFVINCERTRNGQYRLSLRRDVIVDNLNAILNADSYITRGTLKETDPFIYNNEGLKFNQIKTSETALKDYTGMPWIVAYISPDVANDHGTVTGKIEGYFDSEYAELSDYPYYQYFNKAYTRLSDTSIRIPCAVSGTTTKYRINFNCSSSRIVSYSTDSSVNFYNVTLSILNTSDIVYNIQQKWRQVSSSALVLDNYANILLDAELNNLLEQDNKIISAAGKLYRIKVNKTYQSKLADIDIGSSTDMAVQGCFWNGNILVSGVSTNLGNKQYSKQVTNYISWYGTEYTLTYEEVSDQPTGNFTYNFEGINLANLETPYGILCMPYADGIDILKSDGTHEYGSLSKEMRLKIFQALGSTASLLYDIQLLPYCPITNLGISDNEITIPSNVTSVPVTITDIAIEQKYLTSIIVAPRANISFKIYSNPITITDVKQQNATDLWRLCSPNYAGSFEFNAAKFFEGNSTVINYFSVDCTFKPYTPYIHVAPEFRGLYGRDFADSRGLICGGDFSIDRTSDAWETYQYNNKNFQLQFDRQIETMEIQKGWSIADSAIGGVGGAITSGITMGYLGGLRGGFAGAAAGAIDAIYNGIQSNVLQQNAIDEAKDQFRWNLGNIQAQPYGLTKVGALNKNNKLFPFLEYYTCTEEEKNAFNNYIKFNAMSVGRMGFIKDYIYTGNMNFIRATIVRIYNAYINSNIMTNINLELSKGVYINAN